ncbi:MAG TPA: alpha/beta fold hydrolase [Bryobacteraceae bacterium]|nr:alpha/beta fold hydrolase [Bryobacteraceae bacterium]
MSDDGQEGFLLRSEGCRLVGVLFKAWGRGTKPTAVLLHGLPGIEQNHDLAHALRDHGWNTLIFHYRGCWGSEGAYTVNGLAEDVRAAIDELTSGRHPKVDPERIVLIGHSMGGWAAIREACTDARVKAVAALGAAADPGTLPFDTPAAASHLTGFLNGITPESFIAQWRALGHGGSALAVAARISPRPLLIVHGGADDVVPAAQALALHDRAADPRKLVVHPDANHSFTRHRAWLQEVLLDWLSLLEITQLRAQTPPAKRSWSRRTLPVPQAAGIE